MTANDVKKLVDESACETQMLEFKRSAYSDVKANRSAKDELLKDVVGMLNGGGGTILIGIEEQAGIATRIVNVENCESVLKKYEQWIANSIDPPALGIGVAICRVDQAVIIAIDTPNGSESAYSYLDSERRPVFPLRVGTQTTQMSSAELRRRWSLIPPPSGLDVELDSLQRQFETAASRFGASKLMLVAESDSRIRGLTADAARDAPGEHPMRGFYSAILREPRIASSLDAINSRMPSIDFGASKVRDTTDRFEAWRIPALLGSFVLRAKEIDYRREFEPLAEGAINLIRPVLARCKPALPADIEYRDIFAASSPISQWSTLLHAACWAGEIPSCGDVIRYWTCAGFSCPYDGQSPVDAIGFLQIPRLEEITEFKELRASNRFTEQWTSEIRQNIFSVSAAFIRSIRGKLG